MRKMLVNFVPLRQPTETYMQNNRSIASVKIREARLMLPFSLLLSSRAIHQVLAANAKSSAMITSLSQSEAVAFRGWSFHDIMY